MKSGSGLVGFYRAPLNSDEIRHGSDRFRSDLQVGSLALAIVDSIIYQNSNFILLIIIYFINVKLTDLVFRMILQWTIYP